MLRAASFIPYAFPKRLIEGGQLLEAEAPFRRGRAARRHDAGLDQEGATAAHRIEQRFFRLPAGEHEDAGRQVLAQRRIGGTGTPAALEERLPGGIEV